MQGKDKNTLAITEKEFAQNMVTVQLNIKQETREKNVAIYTENIATQMNTRVK